MIKDNRTYLGVYLVITIMLTEIKMEIWRVKKTNTLVKMRRRSETKKKVINRNLGSTSRNIDF